MEVSSDQSGTIPSVLLESAERPPQVLPHVMFLGDQESMRREHPESPFSLSVSPARLAELLRQRGFSDTFIRNLTIQLHYKDTSPLRVLESLTGKIIMGFVTVDEPNELNVSVTGFNKLFRRELEILGDRIYDRKTPFPVRAKKFFKRLANWYIQGSSTSHSPGFFAGDFDRRERYLELASKGKIPKIRAMRFMEQQVLRILESRVVLETFEHEFDHMKSPKELAIKTGVLLGAAIGGGRLAFNLAGQVADATMYIALQHGIPLTLASVAHFIVDNAPFALAIPAVDKLKGILLENRAYNEMQSAKHSEWADVVGVTFSPRWNLNFSWDERDFTWKEIPSWKHEEEESPAPETS